MNLYNQKKKSKKIKKKLYKIQKKKNQILNKIKKRKIKRY